jgi:hypothetical protein
MSQQHVDWASTKNIVDGKVLEHVSFESFVKTFLPISKEEATKQYKNLICSTSIKLSRRRQLERDYKDILDSKLDNCWNDLMNVQADHEFRQSCDTVVKKTAVLEASLAMTSQGLKDVVAKNGIYKLHSL